MIVAARTRDREAHEAAADEVDAVVDDVVLIIEEAASERQESHRGEIARIVFRDEVGGELRDDELIVGHVVVERADDPVAKRVCERVFPLLLEDVALRVRVARDVEPVTAPAFAVARRGEQAVDGFRVGVGRLVVFKRADFLRCRRQSGEVESGAAQERAAISRRRKCEARGVELREQEGVDFISDFGLRISDFRDAGFSDRLECPVRPGGVLRGGRRWLVVLRPREAHAHPFRERGDLRIRELVRFLRHLRVALVIDRLELHH